MLSGSQRKRQRFRHGSTLAHRNEIEHGESGLDTTCHCRIVSAKRIDRMLIGKIAL
jgi:hypothetical protein